MPTGNYIGRVISSLSEGTETHLNEDAYGYKTHNTGALDLWVIDGASSVADKNYIDQQSGDVRWYVSTLNQYLKEHAKPSSTQKDTIFNSLAFLKREFDRKASNMPKYAWPLAALSWIRISNNRITCLALGDCISLARCGQDTVNLDPYNNPQETVIKEEISALKEKGIVDIKHHLLPLLRSRREEQHSAKSPDIMGFNPEAASNARTSNHDIQGQTKLMLMSDGFFRVVDPYALYKAPDLISASFDKGLEALYKELRNHEAKTKERHTVKKADDATAIIAHITPSIPR